MEQSHSQCHESRIADGSINEQSLWSYQRECADADPARRCRTALIDCTGSYTFEQMFEQWERYARVFSALGMTGANGARAGIAGTISAEPIFAFYGLNMTGTTVSMLSYPDFLPSGEWRNMVAREKLTDLVLSDIMLSPELWPELEQARKELGLRHIILLHSRLGGPCAGPAELVYNELNYHRLRRTKGVVYMDALLKQYADAPIEYGSGSGDHIAIITHTSGSSRGTRKPLPYQERALNTVATDARHFFHAMFPDAGQLRASPSFDFSSFMCMCGMIHANLARGDCVVLTFFGFLHPKFVRAVKYYRLNVLFTSGFMIDSWIQRDDLDEDAFASVKSLSCGGSYLPQDKLKKNIDFARAHGYQGYIFRGYGMSELGGVEITVPPDSDADILGFPHPVEDFRVQDDDGQFYTADQGERTGVLYATSKTMCLNVLDGETLFDLIEIDGRKFLCTNDKVRVNADGSFSYAGRADRYFANNEGVRFEAGQVETELSRQPGISRCVVAPVLDKRIHDSVPVLYVVPEAQGEAGAEAVRQALVNVFIGGGLAERSCLPSQFVLVNDIPCNSSGKVDVFRVTRERLRGRAYNTVPVHRDGVLADIATALTDHPDSITGGTLIEGMEGRSALGIYDLFNASSASQNAGFLPGLFSLLDFTK